MFSIKLCLIIFSLIAILEPTLIHSLPQNSEDPILISTEPDQVPAPIFNTAASETSDDNLGDTTLTSEDTDSDPVVATSYDPSDFTENDFTVAAKPPNCRSKRDQGSDASSAPPIDGQCPSRILRHGIEVTPGKSDPDTTNEEAPGTERKPGDPKAAPTDHRICKKDPFLLHLCGWGPPSSTGRVDIPNYFHRQLIFHMNCMCQMTMLPFLFRFTSDTFVQPPQKLTVLVTHSRLVVPPGTLRQIQLSDRLGGGVWF